MTENKLKPLLEALRRWWWCTRAAWHYVQLADMEFAPAYAMAESLYENDPDDRDPPRAAVMEDLTYWTE